MSWALRQPGKTLSRLEQFKLRFGKAGQQKLALLLILCPQLSIGCRYFARLASPFGVQRCAKNLTRGRENFYFRSNLKHAHRAANLLLRSEAKVCWVGLYGRQEI